DNVLALARHLGITTFDESERYGLSLTLGGGEVRLLELTAAYGAFANGGFKVEPVAILRVEDDQGDVLREWHPHQDEQVLDERVAHLITDILSDDLARIPAFGEGGVLELTRPAAVKTGTTSDWRDNWTIGYTPDLVCGVWVGNAMGAPMRGVSGITGAAPIWHDFVEEALKGKPVREFVEPEGIVHVEVCALSGKLPSRYCPYRREEIFIAGTEPQEVCTLHRPVAIDVATSKPATPDTPPEQVAEQVFTFLPAEARQWGRERGIPDPPLAVRFSSLVIHPSPLVMTSPAQGSLYRLSSVLPPSDQRIEVSARPGEGVSIASLTLYVDGQPLACLEAPPYWVMWSLEPGEHVFRAVGRDLEGSRLESEAVRVTVE
ncbi:MAG: penicillin-binding transpeptidase domain-containing protein, partial [Chloroflexota bacterium]|nr:penicillin-binding transpeptidase domain-containing protein [Chloroflexota bacterium]